MFRGSRGLSYLLGVISWLIFANSAMAELEYNLPLPASTITQEIYDLHMMTAWIGLVIMIIVTGLIVYALYTFRKSKDYQPDLNFHESWFGRWAWVLVPVIVLGIDLSVASFASSTLSAVESHEEAGITVKVTGSQWKWSYEYLEEGIKIVSNNKELPPTDPLYLRDVDEPIVLPVGQRIRFLHTTSDVLHAWWVPAIIYKKDAIPGYINETWTNITKTGTYRGQCAENCGTGHAFMPIVVKAVEPDKYTEWVAQKKQEMAIAEAEAKANKEWSMDELMARGKEVYAKNCVACHQVNGQGLAGVFPALAGSQITTEDLPAHIAIVLNGKQGTAMAAWGPQLNDLEIASVITYERNAWGNDTGELVQPKAIAAAR